LEITDALESLRDSNLSSDVELLRAYVEVIRTNGLTEPGDVWQKLADECIATISKVENAIQAANELMKNLSFCECPDVKFADIAAGTQKWKDLATEKVREMAERVAGAYLSN
jgi:hypothetical protein